MPPCVPPDSEKRHRHDPVHPHGRPRPRCVRRFGRLDRGHRGTAQSRHPGDRAAQPAAWPRRRRGVHRVRGVSDRRPVILVGHSYGGALITVAGTTENVVGLVYMAAYVLEEGESLGELQGRFPASPLVSNLKQWTYPVEDGGPAVEVTIDADAFPSVFAADVPADLTKVLAVAQRPLAAAAFEETAAAAAWKTKPSWALVAGADEAINPEVERFGAKRAGATVVEIEGASHAVAVSHPKEVADLIRDAVRATS
ncbi:alpha/beta hydrolase [Streptomyces sp. TRM72054]|uniref:alpha/beta hydrolase n=1 Tax=Streptomyces sp. TRM72054 TaxID=2870562 RepID=UPI0027E0BADA|nr:alpha/beta hydrolase [Streptomyces sp. TRM72054]MBX9392904.1 alpha/beta hydrolase [Streptomyces sp. TRM72054]